jgi:hypothetical protein
LALNKILNNRIIVKVSFFIGRHPILGCNIEKARVKISVPRRTVTNPIKGDYLGGRH